MPSFTQEVEYLFLFSAVLILPKIIKRFRIPIGITCIFLGLLCSFFWKSFNDDQLLLLLSRLGITSLFLFAGMEVEMEELKENKGPISKHLALNLLMIGFVSAFIGYFFHLDLRPAIILTIGLMTPSAGFILDSISDFKLTKSHQYWIKSKSISEEILSVFILFFAMQSHDANQLIISIFILVGLLTFLPILFKVYVRYVAPYAPKSEVAFLIILALVCGVITKKIGTYYLVGAFIVGLIAGRFKHFMGKVEGINIFNALSIFFGIFIPFYFFKAGLGFSSDHLNKEGFFVGLGFILILIPIRFLFILYTQKKFVDNRVYKPWKISLSLMPNLIFGLVISSILTERYNVDSSIIAGLFIYTIFTSILPTFSFKKVPPKEYDTSSA